jgi:uncharacterized membrane protein YeaQ/YmgE (transglycosylase-associated protein family)
MLGSPKPKETFMPSWTTLVTWLIVGAIAGSLASNIFGLAKRGYTRITNFGVGLAGALIGGALFRVLKINLALGKVSISLQDLLSALVGAMILLVGMRLYRTRNS